MSVKLIDNEAFYGYRVRRTVDGKLFQEYFSLKNAGKRANPVDTKKIEKEAKARDVALNEQQKQAKTERKGERCFHDDGSVKGISFLKKKEKSGNITPIFQVGIASEADGKIVCTSFSVNAHGLNGAWEKAVESYAHHKNIPKGSKLYKEVEKAMPKVDMSDVEAAKKKVAAKKAAKPAAKKAAPKKAAAKPAAKKAAPKKAAAKPAAKKAAPKKAAAKPAAKKAAPKKAAAKPAAKKAAPKKAAAKPAAKKAAPKKAAAKPAAKKAAPKKAAAKPAAKKAAPKKAAAKPAAKKAAPKKAK